uniref:ATP synthase F0 subunit 8 n=1 Tax=Natrix natrix TaxID=100823 RepID=A0A7D5U4S7_NATNA|nr:ATP synthase F0 subunit 8 [Natrix natrix]
MPQLDTIFILAVFLWTWSLLFFMVKKINTYVMMTGPKTPWNFKDKQSPTLPWT